MTSLLNWSFIVSLVLCHTPSIRIVGGKIVQADDYPWMASLRYHGKHHCGAMLFREDAVLSAAHCLLLDGPNPWRIAIPFKNKLKKAKLYEVDQVIIHPLYNKTTTSHDAALWIPKTSLPLLTTRLVLADPNFIIPGKKLNILGWGRTFRSASLKRNRDSTTDLLRMAKVPIIPNDDCLDIYYDIDIDSQFCAGFEVGGKDGCEGDSGGPIFHQSERQPNVITLAGTMSSGDGCGEPGLPGVYTRAHIFKDLLEKKDEMDLTFE